MTINWSSWSGSSILVNPVDSWLVNIMTGMALEACRTLCCRFLLDGVRNETRHLSVRSNDPLSSCYKAVSLRSLSHGTVLYAASITKLQAIPEYRSFAPSLLLLQTKP